MIGMNPAAWTSWASDGTVAAGGCNSSGRSKINVSRGVFPRRRSGRVPAVRTRLFQPFGGPGPCVTGDCARAQRAVPQTQNSLPSGSRITAQWTPRSACSSTRVAPRPRAAPPASPTRSRWTSSGTEGPPPARRSMCTRFLMVLASGTFWKNRRGWPSASIADASFHRCRGHAVGREEGRPVGEVAGRRRDGVPPLGEGGRPEGGERTGVGGVEDDLDGSCRSVHPGSVPRATDRRGPADHRIRLPCGPHRALPSSVRQYANQPPPERRIRRARADRRPHPHHRRRARARAGPPRPRPRPAAPDAGGHRPARRRQGHRRVDQRAARAGARPPGGLAPGRPAHHVVLRPDRHPHRARRGDLPHRPPARQ